jgi:hypothetical protein
MESMLEQVKEGFIVTVDETSKGAYPDADQAKAAALLFADAVHKPDLHVTDYTVAAPHPSWYYDYTDALWVSRA